MWKIGIIIFIFFIRRLNAVGVQDLLKDYGIGTTYNIRTTLYPTHDEYDFIIVGAGSAGSAIAKRLSENNKWKVLLLEAGQPEGIINQIPSLLTATHQTSYNWGYRLQRQKGVCTGMKDGRCTWPRGKSLGGTSSINGMVYSRGNKLDYDLWASQGNEGWSFDDVLPYFMKSENFEVPVPYNASYHGTKGPVCVQNIPYHTKLAESFLEAGKTLGHNIVEYNGPQQLGFSYLQVTMDHGARCSASRAYLRYNKNNLEIVTNAFVTKVLINDHKHAYGVQYEINRVARRVFASKEIILSAGTIDSAKLLMLSGIGPKKHLEEQGINVIKNAKVGFNMYEHVAFWGLVFTVNNSDAMNLQTFISPENLAEYYNNRSGPLSTPIGVEAIAFLKTKYAQDHRPDLELLFFSGGVHSDNGLTVKPSFGISDEVYNKFFKPLEFKEAFTIWPIVQLPKSRGRLKLRSKNPYAQPILRGNLLSDPYDEKIILEGIKYAIKLIKTEPFKKFNAQLYNEKIPGCTSYKFASDDYFRCAVKILPAMLNHEVGTVKMGPITDRNSVVDPELRVHGINRLRVIDASIMPMMPVGHMNAGVYMIGEKGADMIKRAWENK